jgi:hypothetical protein
MINFEERALQELKLLAARGDVPAIAAIPGRPTRPRASLGRRITYGLAVSAVLAVVVAIGVPMSGGGDAEAQPFEVVKRPDGGVLFKVAEFRNAKGLEQRLRDLGVRVVVDYVPYGRKCAAARFTEHPISNDDLNAIYHWLPTPTDRKLTDEEMDFHTQGWTEVRPELMPPGTTLVVTATLTQTLAKDMPDPGYRDGRRVHNTDQTGSTSVYELAEGPVGPCVLVDDPNAVGPARDNGPTPAAGR